MSFASPSRGNPGYPLAVLIAIGGREEALEHDMGAVIMLGTLFGLIFLIFGVVLRYDPEARCSSTREAGDA
jgi:hypothetical protein